MPKDVAILTVVQLKNDREVLFDNRLAELSELTRSAGGNIANHVKVMLERPTSNFYISTGKVTQIARDVQKNQATVVIFNVDLSPIQSRNIESEVGVRVVDRTGLILDIFSRRAKSHAGRIQVELAQLNYVLPRLVGRGVIMSRLGGGIGTRGPGEQKLEVDRRKIRDRIVRLKRELEKLRAHQKMLRNRRHQQNFSVVALIGYTNAGKSTLLNALTRSNVFVEDKLFATLDPTTRVLHHRSREQILFTDTVGFLLDLPHSLIEAFRATLDEVTEADVLVHVVDASDPVLESNVAAVGEVLKELDAEKKPTVFALNKVDVLDVALKEKLSKQFPESIFISAKHGIALDEFITTVIRVVQHAKGQANDQKTHRTAH